MTIINPFEETKRKIETYGWVTGQLGNHEVGFCIGGAFRAVLEENVEACIDTKAAAQIMYKRLPKGKKSVFNFNDREAEWDFDVFQLLKKCAADWDERFPSV